MVLKHLSLINYKNIAEAELDLSSKINCFIGMNGEGKTNLLDAIYFLSLCKSATTNQDSLVIKHDGECLSLAGNYQREDGTCEQIHCGIKRGQKKIIRRGKKPYKKLAEHIGLIPLVMVSPNDHQLIDGGSEERRRFMDVVISQYDPIYLESLMRYNKALQQRNSLLKMEEDLPIDIISIYEEQMATEGEIIYERRKEYVEKLTPIFQQYYMAISGNKESVTLQYTSHCQRGPLLEQLQRDRYKEHAIGYSLHGIHKDDLESLLNGFAIKREGSQGQNKTFLIAMKLAQFKLLQQTGNLSTPLLLLDDIFDKLDAERVQQIVQLVDGEDFGQIFITDTNRDHLNKILQQTSHDYKIYHVEKGVITPC